jgi:DNA-binding transcriptional LysR family regulator
LNLLIIFVVIAEERSVTKASGRLLLSQPAVSRALQRARSMFQDELVIRSSSGFELTLRGSKILQELEQLLPKIEGLVVPSVFDPKRDGAISAFLARTMFAWRCFRTYAADMRPNVIR